MNTEHDTKPWAKRDEWRRLPSQPHTQTQTQLKKKKNGIPIQIHTYQFLPMDQPLINFLYMKDVLTRQHPHFITFHKFGQTYSALCLHVEPWRFGIITGFL